MNATETRPEVISPPVRDAAPSPAKPVERPFHSFEDGNTDQQVPDRKPTPQFWSTRIRGASQRKGRLAVVGFIVYIASLGGLFYAGADHQSIVDQQLHAQYYPAQASYYGNTSSYDPQTAAALSAATPPGASAPGIGASTARDVPTPTGLTTRSTK